MLWRRRRSADDFADEVRSHLEHEIDRLVAEGLPPKAARREALRRFGDVHAALERFRPSYRAGWLGRAARDVRFALRSLRREPLFALAIIATLALGIGLNAGIFTILYSLLLRPLPLPEPDRLVTVHQELATSDPYLRAIGGGLSIGASERRVNGSLDLLSYPEYLYFREAARSFDALAAFAPLRLTFAAGTPFSIAGLGTSCDYFRALRVDMALGRGFAADECASRGEAPVVVLSYGFWQSRLGGEQGIVGSTVTLNGRPFTVIGVAARGFAGTDLQAPELWLPITVLPRLGEDHLDTENLSWLHVIGRLGRDATPDHARAELTTLARQFHAAEPDLGPTVAVHRATLAGPRGRFESGGAAVAAMAVVAIVLLLACLNITNLLLSRAPARQRAVRIRLSLGAKRRQIVMQLLTESLILALLGGTAGLAVSMLVPPALASLLPLRGLPLPTLPDAGVLAYTFGVSLVAAIAFGLVPALETTRVDLATALRSQTAGAGGGRSAWRLRQVVVSTQFAGSLLLLVVAGLFVRGVSHAERIDPGYRIENIYAFHPQLLDQGYDEDGGAAFLAALRTRVAAIPGVETTALARQLPLQGGAMALISREGMPPDRSTADRQVFHTTVSPEYFDLMEIPIIRGRTFDPRLDDGATVAAVISESTARRHWGTEDPIGREFRLGETRMRVVGVARDTRHVSITDPDRPFLYAALTEQGPGMPDQATGKARDLVVVARVAPGASVAGKVMGLAQQLDPAVVIEVQSLEDRLAGVLEPNRLSALLVGLLGSLAAVLALIGIYSALAYAVAQRWHELGVRLALGANRRDILVLVMRQGLAALVPGMLVGLLLAIGAGRVIRSQLFGLDPLDPIAFGTVILLLTAAALVAMLHPARRASRLDPVDTLRSD